MSAHTAFSPSMLPMLNLCRGYRPDRRKGDAAQRGDRVHAALAPYVASGVLTLATLADDGERAIAQRGADAFDALRRRFPSHQWWSERRVDTGIADCQGTADVIGVDTWNPNLPLVVLDWKSGFSEKPHAGRSHQVAAYALGAAREFGWGGNVLAIIAELDRGSATECNFSPHDLIAARVEVSVLIEQGRTRSPLTPAERACKHCTHRETCPALAGSVSATASALPSAPAPGTLTAQRAAALLSEYDERIKLVATWAKALREAVANGLDCGELGPECGWTIEEKAGQREWKDAAAAEAALVEWQRNHGPGTTGVVPLSALCSPAEAERRLKAAGYGTPREISEYVTGLCSRDNVRRTLVRAEGAT